MTSTKYTSAQLLTLPNAMSAVRLPLAIAFWFAVDHPALALGIAAAAGLSDMLDGAIARSAHHSTRLGGIIDPIFDKIFVVVAVAALVWHQHIPLGELSLILARDLGMIPLILPLLWISKEARIRLTLKSNYWGKATTVVQFAAMISAMIHPAWLWGLSWLSAAVGLGCVWSYGRRALLEYEAYQLEQQQEDG